MLPPSADTLFSTADNSSTFMHRHEPPYHMESSSCARPQMAWQMYEQLLRIASNQQKQQQQNQSTSKDEKVDAKRVWLAAFTGPSLIYRQGVAAGVAEPL